MSLPITCAIAAMGENRIIGNANRLPDWHIPEDMEYLRKTTRGYPIIMGRSTYESICGYRNVNPLTERAMPGRLNVVISTQENYFDGKEPEGVKLALTPEMGLTLAQNHALSEGKDKIFVFGGAAIYDALLPMTNRLYLTEIDGSFDGDAYFPDFNTTEWEKVAYEQHANNAHKFAFAVYERKY